MTQKKNDICEVEISYTIKVNVRGPGGGEEVVNFVDRYMIDRRNSETLRNMSEGFDDAVLKLKQEIFSGFVLGYLVKEWYKYHDAMEDAPIFKNVDDSVDAKARIYESLKSWMDKSVILPDGYETEYEFNVGTEVPPIYVATDDGGIMVYHWCDKTNKMVCQRLNEGRDF